MAKRTAPRLAEIPVSEEEEQASEPEEAVETDGETVYRPPPNWDLFALTDDELEKLSRYQSMGRAPFTLKLLRVNRKTSRPVSLPGVFDLGDATQGNIASLHGGGLYDVKICDNRHTWVMGRRIDIDGPEHPDAAAMVRGSQAVSPAEPTSQMIGFAQMMATMAKVFDRPDPTAQMVPMFTALMAQAEERAQRAEARTLSMLERMIQREAAPQNDPMAMFGQALKTVVALQTVTGGATRDPQDKFLNHTVPGMMKDLTPLGAIMAAGVVKDPETKKAFIEFAENAAYYDDDDDDGEEEEEAPAEPEPGQ